MRRPLRRNGVGGFEEPAKWKKMPLAANHLVATVTIEANLLSKYSIWSLAAAKAKRREGYKQICGGAGYGGTVSRPPSSTSDWIAIVD